MQVIEGGAMARRLFAFALLLTALSGPSPLQATARSGQAPSSANHISWVAEALKRMQAIQPGMTRADLLNVFTTEGGLFTGLQRTFVSRDCPYFKVDVEFEAVGRPNRDASGRVTLEEGKRDIIVRISRPYLQFTVAD
jgi:hypothetical protein